MSLSKYYTAIFFCLQIVMFEESLVLTVRKALLDPLPEVREAAADAFDKLHDTINQKALDGILPHVLQKLVCAVPM